jgi:hypothetical protein
MTIHNNEDAPGDIPSQVGTKYRIYAAGSIKFERIDSIDFFEELLTYISHVFSAFTSKCSRK